MVVDKMEGEYSHLTDPHLSSPEFYEESIKEFQEEQEKEE